MPLAHDGPRESFVEPQALLRGLAGGQRNPLSRLDQGSEHHPAPSSEGGLGVLDFIAPSHIALKT
jgi:hypothetical protein